MVYVFKPLTTTLLLLIAVASGCLTTDYGRLVAVAIVLCVAGDVFLMLPRDRFLQGLASFLLAHLVLIVAFVTQGIGVTWWLLTPVAVTAVTMYSILAPHLGRMKVPVIVYVAGIGIMAWFALERWHLQGTRSAALAAVGSVLFLFSDSTLALNRFKREFRAAEFLVLSTYYLSLWLTALSTRPGWM